MGSWETFKLGAGSRDQKCASSKTQSQRISEQKCLMYPDQGGSSNTIAQIEGGENKKNDQKSAAPSSQWPLKDPNLVFESRTKNVHRRQRELFENNFVFFISQKMGTFSRAQLRESRNG